MPEIKLTEVEALGLVAHRERAEIVDAQVQQLRAQADRLAAAVLEGNNKFVAAISRAHGLTPPETGVTISLDKDGGTTLSWQVPHKSAEGDGFKAETARDSEAEKNGAASKPDLVSV